MSAVIVNFSSDRAAIHLSIKALKIMTQKYNPSLPLIMSNVMVMIIIAHNDNGNDNDSP